MDLIIELYNEYINDDQYVYYKNHDTIIIMKKMSDDNKCLSDIKPKKYYSDSLKVILMFDIYDPYKLVSNITKYKINELIESNYYESVKDAYTLYQEYYASGQLMFEYNYIDEIKNGLFQQYYENGQLCVEYHCINNNINGLYKEYYESGQLELESNYIDNLKNGLYKSYYWSGQLYKKYHYTNGLLNGSCKEYFKSGQLIKEVHYVLGKFKN
jgi:antitoxin component YwqK of YwqJK toxin-antitoxin module